jgi:transcriptional regulator with XRE-family HTH domain
VDQAQALGARFRAVRIKRGWRQADVGARARVDRSVVSRIERGHLESVTLGTLLRVARTLDIQVTVNARSRGADLDRLVNAHHAGLHESVVAWFGRILPEWILDPEVSFAIGVERGVIDLLAWHPGRRALLIIELKTDVVEISDLMAKAHQRRRLARRIVAERGWDPVTVSVWIVVADGSANRARVSRHLAVLRTAFPVDGRSMRSWLRSPDRAVAALSFWPRPDLAARHRVRVRVPGRVAAGAAHG